MKVLRSTLVVFAFALCSSPSAFAANVAPNPSFTTDCAGVPCQWEPSSVPSSGSPIAVVTRDTSTFASTPASIQVTTGRLFGEGARSACITNGIGNGTFSLGYSYLVSDADVANLGAVAIFYTGTTCDPNNFADSLSGTFVTRPVSGWPSPAAWTPVAPVSDTITGSPGSARVFLTVTPNGNCTGDPPACTAVANFDDVVFDSPIATAVRFQSAAASRSPRGVMVRWRTAAEFGTLGFNVYREVAGKRQRLNRFLITGGRGSYSFRDRLAPKKKTLRYWIEEVAVDGSRSWHGPLRVGF